MPFTPSHAVVALPFLRTPMVPAAIAVGAMTPDLPLFLPWGPLTYQVMHTNIVIASVVAGLLLALWYVLVRPGVRELSPDALAARMPDDWDRIPLRRDRSRPRMQVTWLALSLLFGVVSHIVWDAFTHEGRWGVRAVPALDTYWGPLLGYKWLQHGTSAIALAILLVAGLLWFRHAARGEVRRVFPAAVRWCWWLSLPVALVAAWGIGMLVHGPLTPGFGPEQLAYRVLPPACGVWGVVTLVLCGVVQMRRARLDIAPERPAGPRSGR